MGILGTIASAKEKFKNTRTTVRRASTRRKVAKLQTLREERLYQQGQANLRTLEAKERAAIAKAKGTHQQPNFVERLGANVQKKNKYAKGFNSGKSILSKENKYPLGGGPAWGKGSGGTGPNWSSLGPPTMKEKGGLNTSDRWGLGHKEAPRRKKKKGRQIVINMR